MSIFAFVGLYSPRSGDGEVIRVTRPRSGSVDRFWAGARGLSLIKNEQTGAGTHPASY
jgi:hypothetical protein